MSTPPARNRIDKLGWVCIQNKNILMARSCNKATYYIPGGKREAGECDRTALIREIKEELSVDLIFDSITSLGHFQGQAHGEPDGVIVNVQCFAADFKGELKPGAEVASFAWLSYADRLKCSPVSASLFDVLKQKKIID